MRSCCRWMWFGVMTPLVAAAAFAAGCGGCSKDGGSEESGSPSSRHSSTSVELKPQAIESRGSISGRVVVKDVDEKDIEKKNDDLMGKMKAQAGFAPCCAAGVPEEDTKDQTWFVGKDHGLEYAVVWLAPPEDHYFKLSKEQDLDDENRGWEKEKILDQPHCQFHPHVMTLFQYYRDDGKEKETGQTAKVMNSAVGVDHNTKCDALSLNSLLGSGKSEKMPPAKPSFKPYHVNCNVHPWMSGYIWSFDHPFAAVTDKDGKFEIKNVPAGMELHLMYWHESMGNKPEQKKMTLEKDKKNDAGTLEVKYKS